MKKELTIIMTDNRGRITLGYRLKERVYLMHEDEDGIIKLYPAAVVPTVETDENDG